MLLAPGTALGPYEIVAFIAAGGMGELYRARDPRLDREVAIKILKADLEAEPRQRGRFEAEARAASSLNHPNIITIHQIGDYDGRCYICMELIDGETLGQVLNAHGPLPEDRVAELARQIAAGLAKAHEAGVIHGDLKPANVMVNRDGLVKILDFGLARLFHFTADADSPTVTAATSYGFAGTPAYMAPEQALGRPVSAHSDIFSLGVILYELACGSRPFRGDTAPTLFDAILHQRPGPMPGGNLAEVIERCLEKEPADRYPSIGAFMVGLEQSVESDTVGAATPRPSIAVMPFRNLSSEKDAEYFSDGLTEDIILDLAKVNSLRVISRTSTMMLKDQARDLRKFGRQLNVDLVLEGSVRRAGDQVRVTAQLVDVATDAHVWGDRMTGSLSDVFRIQEEISRSIVDSLKLTLTPEEDRRIAGRPIADVRAYECYLRARPEIWRFSEAGLERARRLIDQGLAIVGDNELLYSSMGLVHWQYLNTGLRPQASSLELAEGFCEKAFALTPTEPQTFLLRALVRLKRDCYRAAVPDLKQALALAPGDSDATLWLCLAYANAGKVAEARSLVAKLERIDPLNPLIRAIPALLASIEGRWDEAANLVRPGVEADAENHILQWTLASNLARAGHTEEALTVFARLKGLASVFGSLSTVFEYALRGEREAALTVLTPETEEMASWDELYSWELAGCLALLGERTRALEWLENAIRRGLIAHRLLGEYDPFLARLHHDAGFRSLIDEAERLADEFEV